MLEEATDGHGGGVTQGADGAAHDVACHVVQQVQIFRTAVTVFDAMHHAIEPAGAFAARRALAAAFLEIEVRQAQERLHHAARFVHDDHSARTEHRAGLGDGVIVHRAFHDDVGRQHRGAGSARDHGLQLLAAAHAACQFEQRRERGAQRALVVAGTCDGAGEREQLGAAVGRLADFQLAGNGGLKRGWPFLPSSDSSSAGASPQM
ncbi:hypothetical protein G6F57_019745 [Rhizopus arrhizus]|nr:hypothetical protein G6F57_019745 [Rhizopus arrhizus]